MLATHVPTGFACNTMYASLDGSLVMCNFGPRANPFTWVEASELALPVESQPEDETVEAALASMQGDRALR